MSPRTTADTRPEEPSAYVLKWTVFSSVCVVLGVAFVVMWWTLGKALVPGIIIGVLIALVGGVAFAFVPRASLGQPVRPMTPKANRKAREARQARGGGAGGTGGAEAGRAGTGSA